MNHHLLLIFLTRHSPLKFFTYFVHLLKFDDNLAISLHDAQVFVVEGESRLGVLDTVVRDRLNFQFCKIKPSIGVKTAFSCPRKVTKSERVNGHRDQTRLSGHLRCQHRDYNNRRELIKNAMMIKVKNKYSLRKYQARNFKETILLCGI